MFIRDWNHRLTFLRKGMNDRYKEAHKYVVNTFIESKIKDFKTMKESIQHYSINCLDITPIYIKMFSYEKGNLREEQMKYFNYISELAILPGTHCKLQSLIKRQRTFLDSNRVSANTDNIVGVLSDKFLDKLFVKNTYRKMKKFIKKDVIFEYKIEVDNTVYIMLITEGEETKI